MSAEYMCVNMNMMCLYMCVHILDVYIVYCVYIVFTDSWVQVQINGIKKKNYMIISINAEKHLSKFTIY
jgi:uncharacterized membrane protein (DUF485 family)